MIYDEIEKMLDETKKIPYPKVKYVKPDIRFAKMLYDDYAGGLGELTAITQYVYEHIDLSKQISLSRVLLKIAIEEMMHLNMIGELITKLGLEPVFISTNNCNWTSKNVKYNTGNLCRTMSYNVELEDAAIEGYKRAIMCTRNEQIVALLKRIILDEENHKKIFNMLADDYKNA